MKKATRKALRAHGFEVRVGHGTHAGEERIELRRIERGHVVAWFQFTDRTVDSERKIGMNVQIIEYDHLTDRQLELARAWLCEKVLAAL